MNAVMTAKEVADFFQISVNAVYAMRNDGKLHALEVPVEVLTGRGRSVRNAQG